MKEENLVPIDDLRRERDELAARVEVLIAANGELRLYERLLGMLMYHEGLVDVEMTQESIARMPRDRVILIGEPKEEGSVRLRMMPLEEARAIQKREQEARSPDICAACFRATGAFHRYNYERGESCPGCGQRSEVLT
jgi:hypothetical protein